MLLPQTPELPLAQTPALVPPLPNKTNDSTELLCSSGITADFFHEVTEGCFCSPPHLFREESFAFPRTPELLERCRWPEAPGPRGPVPVAAGLGWHRSRGITGPSPLLPRPGPAFTPAAPREFRCL